MLRAHSGAAQREPHAFCNLVRETPPFCNRWFWVRGCDRTAIFTRKQLSKPCFSVASPRMPPCNPIVTRVCHWRGLWCAWWWAWHESRHPGSHEITERWKGSKVHARAVTTGNVTDRTPPWGWCPKPSQMIFCPLFRRFPPCRIVATVALSVSALQRDVCGCCDRRFNGKALGNEKPKDQVVKLLPRHRSVTMRHLRGGTQPAWWCTDHSV